jgi:hypothetical protein
MIITGIFNTVKLQFFTNMPNAETVLIFEPLLEIQELYNDTILVQLGF